MNDQIPQAEFQTLRDRVTDLETARTVQVKVDIEGFEGIRQLSRAIEKQQLDRFALQNSTPNRVFWSWFWAFVIGCAVLVVASLAISGHLF